MLKHEILRILSISIKLCLHNLNFIHNNLYNSNPEYFKLPIIQTKFAISWISNKWGSTVVSDNLFLKYGSKMPNLGNFFKQIYECLNIFMLIRHQDRRLFYYTLICLCCCSSKMMYYLPDSGQLMFFSMFKFIVHMFVLYYLSKYTYR
jgi:hypothetical protein